MASVRRDKAHIKQRYREFRQAITEDSPDRVTIEQARAWVRWLQTDSGYAPGTQTGQAAMPVQHVQDRSA